jgi:FMN phosphatase YigB (HAD superfamily)
MIRVLLFDWGNTVMVDFNLPGPMYNWEKVAWVEGAEESLKLLTRDYPCYIATNAGQSDAEAVRKGLQRVGAEKYFTGVFASSDLGFEKPDPRFFGEIIRKLSVPPGSFVMIGDNYEKDIAGAKDCGMKTIYYCYNSEQFEFPLADACIRSLNDLPSAIRAL